MRVENYAIGCRNEVTTTVHREFFIVRELITMTTLKSWYNNQTTRNSRFWTLFAYTNSQGHFRIVTCWEDFANT